MAATRGRTIGSFGQSFTPYMVSGSIPTAVSIRWRAWGIPTHPSWRERPEKWDSRRVEAEKGHGVLIPKPLES